jgi:GGDEF domain-containing protein
MWELSRVFFPDRPRYEVAYWLLAICTIVIGTVTDLVERVGPLSLVGDLTYAVLAVMFFLLWRRATPNAYWYVCVHILIGIGIVAVDSHTTAAPSPIMRQMHTTMLVLGMLGLGICGGGRAFALGLPIALLTHPGSASLPLTMVLIFALGFTGTALHGAFRSMAAAKLAFERLAHEDVLTGLGNRRAAADTFAHYQAIAQRHSTPLLLMLWDLDNLKRVNDSRGHQAGDAYIKSFAETLRRCVRQEDVPFRLAGDEFVSLHLGLSEGEAIVQRVRAAFADVSVGWVMIQGQDIDVALELADKAMYDDKATRKGGPPESSRVERRESSGAPSNSTMGTK